MWSFFFRCLHCALELTCRLWKTVWFFFHSFREQVFSYSSYFDSREMSIQRQLRWLMVWWADWFIRQAKKLKKAALHTTWVLIGTVCAVLLAVTEKTSLNTISITTRQEAILAKWLVCDKKWLHFTLFVFGFAVFNSVFPIACLFFDIKKQTGWTTNGL